MRRALLSCLAIAFALACGDDITEPTTAGTKPTVTGTTAVSGRPLFATTTTDDGLSISTDKDDYQPGDVVHLTGSGWQPGDVLDVVLTDDPLTHDPHKWTVQVAADGTFEDDTYTVDDGDVNVAFTLIATSRATGRSLTVNFTDNITNGSISVTVDNLASATVSPSATISLAITASVTSQPGGPTSWKSTGWVLLGAPANTTPAGKFANCVNTADVTGISGNGTEATATFNITAPATPGLYDLWVALSDVDGTGSTACGGGGTNTRVRFAGTVTVQAPTAAATTLSVSPAAGIEEGTTSFSATLTRTSGGAIISGQTISFTLNGAAVGSATTDASGIATVSGVSLAGIAVGTYPTAIGGSFAAVTDFAASNGTGSLTVTAKIPVTGSFTVSNKPYDGNNSATITGRSLSGVVGSDNVSLIGGSATFDTKDVGTGKTVTGTGFTLSGSDAGKYSLVSSTLTTTANITAITLTGHFTAEDKVYDGNTGATISGRTLTGGIIGTEVVTLTGGTATFADENVADDKTVTGTGFTLGGADAGNYVLASTTLTTKADITARDLTVSATGQNKVYDRTTDATVTLSDNRLDDDVFTASYSSASFADWDVGNGKTVNVSGISISGADAGNYNLINTTAATTANITQRPLAVTAVAASKIWDGNTTATLTSLSATPLSGDVVAPITYSSASFDNPDVGNNKTVTVNEVAFTGIDGPNYSVITPVTTTASINPWSLTGFYAPVDMPLQAGGYQIVWNTVKGGSTVPLKFEVFAGTTEKTDVAIVKFFTTKVTCPATAVTDEIEIVSTGGTTLRYDLSAGQFIQNWQTPKPANLCYRVTMTTQDESSIVAYFKTK